MRQKSKADRFWYKMGDITDRGMMLLFLLLLFLSGYCLYDTVKIYDRASDKSLLQYKPELLDDGTTADDSHSIPGSVAWVTIDNTTIDYPIMQAEDNTFYLNVDPYGKPSITGSIFLDARNSSDFSDSFNLLYGHHVEGRTMFGALDAFADQTYLEKHGTGTLIVGKKVYHLHPFALCTVTQRDESVFGHPDETSFTQALTTAKQSAITIASHEDAAQILALSTCKADPAESDNRTVLFCAMTPA